MHHLFLQSCVHRHITSQIAIGVNQLHIVIMLPTANGHHDLYHAIVVHVQHQNNNNNNMARNTDFRIILLLIFLYFRFSPVHSVLNNARRRIAPQCECIIIL